MPKPSYDEPFADGEGADRIPPPSALQVHIGSTGSRVPVAVTGEFCLDDSQILEHALREALARSAEGVDLDLGELVLADCSALNVLLALRGQAVSAGKTVVVTAASPAAERLLTFTDTYALFAVTRDDTGPVDGERGPRDSDERLLQTEVVQLRRALRTRPDIDLARGILMASFGLNADEAWKVLVTVSQNTNTKLHHVARQVVTARGAALPDAVQRQLTAAATASAGGAGLRP